MIQTFDAGMHKMRAIINPQYASGRSLSRSCHVHFISKPQQVTDGAMLPLSYFCNLP